MRFWCWQRLVRWWEFTAWERIKKKLGQGEDGVSLIYINILSINGHWCRFNAKRNPQFGMRWIRKLYLEKNSSICDPAAVKQPWFTGHSGQVSLWLDSSSLLLASWVCSALQRNLQCFSSSWGNAVFRLQWKCKVHSPSQRGACWYRQKSQLLAPDWSTLLQMRTPNPHSLIGPKGSVLIGQTLWLVWAAHL